MLNSFILSSIMNFTLCLTSFITSLSSFHSSVNNSSFFPESSSSTFSLIMLIIKPFFRRQTPECIIYSILFYFAIELCIISIEVESDCKVFGTESNSSFTCPCLVPSSSFLYPHYFLSVTNADQLWDWNNLIMNNEGLEPNSHPLFEERWGKLIWSRSSVFSFLTQCTDAIG